MDDDELPIPDFATLPSPPFRLRAGALPEDTDIWVSLNGNKLPRFGIPTPAISAWWADQQDAAIMLEMTKMRGVKPAMKRLALFLKYAG